MRAIKRGLKAIAGKSYRKKRTGAFVYGTMRNVARRPPKRLSGRSR